MAIATTRDALIKELSALGLYNSVVDGAFDTLFSAVTKNKTQIVALTPLADPATATTTQIATLLNALIAALKA